MLQMGSGSGSSLINIGDSVIVHGFFAGYNTGSGNYVSFFVPLNISDSVTGATAEPVGGTVCDVFSNGKADDVPLSSASITGVYPYGVQIELHYPSTKTINIAAVVCLPISGLKLTFT